MRAVTIREGEVVIEQHPDPLPGAGEVLVGVRAAGLNGADMMQRRGLYPAPPGSPAEIPGLELAGEVSALGLGAHRFEVGARVMGIVGGGGQAELAVVHERQLMAVPAALGWTAAPNILEARFGWFNAAGGGFDRAAIAGRLGNPWTFASPGISIKPFPCGSLTHPAMGEIARIVREHDVRPGSVEKVDIGGNHSMVTTLLHHRPTTGLQAKFSMEFAAAILILERRAGLAQFTDDVVQRPEVQELIGRVNFYVDPEAEGAGFDKMTSIVKIHLKGGKVLSGLAQFAKGSPANPMSFEEVADKFRGCADFARWPSTKTEAVVELVRTLEAAPEVSKLTAALTA